MIYALDQNVRALADAFGEDIGDLTGQVGAAAGAVATAEAKADAAQLAADNLSDEIAPAQLRKNALDATRAPLPSDDATQGYSVGSRWLWQGQEWVLDALGAEGAAWNEVTLYDAASLPALLASRRNYPVGSIVTTRAEGYIYEVVSSSPDLTTAGGIMLRVRPSSDGYNLKAFNPPSDGTGDASLVMQRCFDRCTDEGVNCRIGHGSYRLLSTCLFDLSAFANKGDEMGPRIIGDGAGIVEILVAYPGAGIRLLGDNTVPGAAQGFSGLSGIKFRGETYRQGIGVMVEKLAFMDFEDIYCHGLDDGIHCVDSLSTSWRNVRARFCNRGWHINDVSTYSPPNAHTFTGCHAGVCFEAGVRYTGGSCLVWVGGSVEGCGGDTAIGQKGGIVVLGSTTTPGRGSGMALHVSGCYFEINEGYDVRIQTGNAAATYSLSSCDFRRTSATQHVANSVYLASSVGSAPADLVLTGCSFSAFNGYTPATTRRAVFVQDNANNVIFTEIGCRYSGADEWPNVRSDRRVASVRFDGRDDPPTAIAARGVSTVTKNGPGDYTVTLKREVPIDRITNVAASGLGSWTLISQTTSSFRLTTKNGSGVNTDYGAVFVEVIR